MNNGPQMVKGSITVVGQGEEAAAIAANRNNMEAIFTNCTAFQNCISEVNNTQIDWFRSSRGDRIPLFLFEDEKGRAGHAGHYLPKLEIKQSIYHNMLLLMKEMISIKQLEKT